ncbi:enoyl-CoA hydratase/isomerase family protein [Rhodococcus aetherivorans]
MPIPGTRLCGHGSGRAFCAGADLAELADNLSFLTPDNPEWGFAGIVHHPIDIPVIAAVNGPAFGSGTEIVLACDLAVINEDAGLGLPEVERGLFAGAGGAFRLPDQIPQKLAAEAILTGEPILASTTLQWGLVNACVPADQALDEAIRLAEKIAANAPLPWRQQTRDGSPP